ncbi:MAG: GatB/YqeY domain-containing protein [Alphaproteobacteria bacterium]|nr:GatB/YqeY domain-containing protein [Alphaproteobacteria bacterium]
MSLREKFTENMKDAMRAKDEVTLSTLRLILSAIKDKDIATRTAESREDIKDEQILSLLQSMVKQRQESIKLYLKGNRPELAERESAEIKIIEGYLPKQLQEDEIKAIVQQTIDSLSATSIKDMGKVMAELKSKHSGKMDFSKASRLVKGKLVG